MSRFARRWRIIALVLAGAALGADGAFADEPVTDDVPAEAPSRQKNDRPKSYRKKDIDFEDRVVEGIRKTTIESDGALRSGRAQPDLHRKRDDYRAELAEQMREQEFAR